MISPLLVASTGARTTLLALADTRWSRAPPTPTPRIPDQVVGVAPRSAPLQAAGAFDALLVCAPLVYSINKSLYLSLSIYCAMPVLATSGNRYTLRHRTNALLTGGRGSLGARVHPWAQGRAGALWRRPRAFLGSLGVGERRLVRGLRRSGPGGRARGWWYSPQSFPTVTARPS